MDALRIPTRRLLLSRTGGVTLSAAAIASLAGCGSMAAAPKTAQSSSAAGSDVNILNVALGPEHEAINAYQLGAASGLLQKPVLDIAVQFQGHHKTHRDALIAAIEKMGGKPVAAKSLDEYAKRSTRRR